MKAWHAMGAALAVVLVMPGAARAQCPGGAAAVPTLGISLVECDCTVGSPNAAAWSFRTPPKVVSIAPGSAAVGVLREGDFILQVAGRPLTTPEGAAAFARAQASAATPALIQRGGRAVEVTLRSSDLCPNVARIVAAAPGSVGYARAATAGRPGVPVLAPTPRPPAPSTPQAPPAAPTPRPAPPLQAVPAPQAPPPPPAPPGVAAWIGIAFSCTDCSVDRANGRWNFRSPPQVYSVESGSPAHSAGLRRGDVLTHVDGVSITTADGGRRWAQVKSGQTMRVSYQRGGTRHAASIRVGEPRTGWAVMAPTAAYRAAVDSSAVATVRAYTEMLQAQQVREEQVLRQLLERRMATDTASKRQMEGVLREYMQQREVNKVQQNAREQEVMRLLERNLVALEARPSVAPRVADQRLRFSGTIGGADVEVRGQNSVVVSELANELVITTSDATIRIKVPRRD